MESVTIELQHDELNLLVEGIRVWFGASNPSDLQLAALGFKHLDDLQAHGRAFLDALGPVTVLRPISWTQTLMLTELGFASDIQGVGYEWSVITGIPDADAVKTLRRLQHKLIHIRAFPGRGTDAFIVKSE